MRKVSVLTGLMVLVFLIGILASSNSPAQECGKYHKARGFWSELTQEQRKSVEDKIAQMRDQGATREETHAAVTEMLKGYGIEVPADSVGLQGRQDFGFPGSPRFFKNLTPEQRGAVRAKLKELRSNKASPEEMHTAMNEMLKSYGVEVPPDSLEPPPGRGFFGQPAGGFWGKLTEEQKEAVHGKMKELRGSNASPEEMHTAIAEMLKTYGIQVPNDSIGPPPGFGCFDPGPGGFWGDLTKDQREAIGVKTKEMRSQNASREEIHAAVVEMLKGYGVNVPGDWEGLPGRGDVGPGPRGLWRNLTAEQREAVKNKVEEMRGQGATREEIRTVVDEMIKGYGIESPANSDSQTWGKTSAENSITAGSYPNPFNPETQIAYTLGVSGQVKIKIYNITGQLIRTFDQGYQPAGSYNVLWDGRNENGDMVASGVYLYRIEAGSYSTTNRMVLLK
jgi:DNA-binding transcriptional regulator YhcF (GntR family)